VDGGSRNEEWLSAREKKQIPVLRKVNDLVLAQQGSRGKDWKNEMQNREIGQRRGQLLEKEETICYRCKSILSSPISPVYITPLHRHRLIHICKHVGPFWPVHSDTWPIW